MAKTVKEVVKECMYRAHIRNLTIITPDKIITGKLSAFIVSKEKDTYGDLEVERYEAVFPGRDLNLFDYWCYDELDKDITGFDLFIITKENANC